MLFLKCQSFVAVSYVDNSAVLESVLLEQMLHYGVVAESVNVYVATDAETIVERSGECAVSVGQTRYAVYYIIW